MTGPGSSPRAIAVAVLTAVEQGETADAALNRELVAGPVDRRDRALATELAYGAIRRRLSIDYQLANWLRRPLAELEPNVRSVLRVGAYQLMFLDRIPGYAVVDEAVTLARRVGHRRVAGLVNAVLRRVAESPRARSLPTDPVEAAAVEHSHPTWVVRRWLDRYGTELTIKLCEWNNRPSPIAIRPNLLRTDPGKLQGKLETEGAAVRPGELLPELGLVISGSGPVDELASHRDGLFQVQDEGAMLAGLVCAPEPGAKVLDACAGRGGKTTHLAELMNNRGRIVALDPSLERLRDLSEACSRLGIEIVEAQVGSAQQAAELTDGGFDVVLVDAPCSGTGVLGRNVDARWRKRPGDIPRLAAQSVDILRAVAGMVRPGGRIVYVTCSLEPEENEDVVRRVLADTGLQLEPDERWVPDGIEVRGEGPGLQLMPPIHRCDGLYLACLRN